MAALEGDVMVTTGSLVVVGMPALGGALALVCLLLGLRAGRRQRLVDDLPTSKTTGVFLGLVELRGSAEAEAPLVSTLTATRCVAYRWQVEESWSRTVTEAYTDGNGRTQTRTRTESGWTTVAQGGEEISFYLQDECGVIRVQPAGAKLEPQTVLERTCGQSDPLYYGKGPTGSVPDSDHRRRFLERAVPLHAALLVVGQAREREDVVAAEIAADAGAPLFLISTRSERQVSRGLRLQSWVLGVLGLVLGVGGFLARDLIAHRPPSHDLRLMTLAGVGYLAACCIGWAWMVFNSLVDLRQRVAQGWGNVEVQLKRRHDLIPNLVGLVSGLRDHERTVQEEVATLRAQLGATPPGRPGPDPAGCLPAVRAIAEAYPELKASTSFVVLQNQLVETEQRVALARSYFNDVATFYNTRLEVIPDRFIA
ncbi:MAG TPA: LemA family protein, partial [Solirubrobacteraceae bacterium]|nr:LemA family protein [Solirubrobacteraceae bacterium]